MARLRFGQSIRPFVVFFMLTFSRADFSNGVYGQDVTSNKIVPQDVESTKLTVDTSEPSKPIWQAPGCHRVGKYNRFTGLQVRPHKNTAKVGVLSEKKILSIIF